MVNILLQTKKSHYVALFLVLSVFASCTSTKSISQKGKPVATFADTTAMVESSAVSSLRMMQQVCSSQHYENIWLSPLSAQMALSIVYDGAEGQTATEMLPWVSRLQLANNDQLQIASALWVKPSFPFKKSFLTTCHKRGAEIYNEPITAAKVNNWADRHTHGKITHVLSDPLPADLAMLVANAVYFKADWSSPFRAENTHIEPFYHSDGTLTDVTMMSQTAHFQYRDALTYSYLSLPYRPSNDGHRYALRILLPHEGVSADDVLMSLSYEQLQLCIDSSSMHKVDLTLPKIELRYSRVLNDDYLALGMQQPFHCPLADFSGMSDSPLCLGMIKQDSYLRIDEKDTEAAAVTTVMVRSMAMPHPEETIEFVVNRPYLLMLQDVDSGLILFMGKIEKIAQ